MSYQNNNAGELEQHNRTAMTQLRHNQWPQGQYPFEHTMNTNTMPDCPIYSGPWHKAILEAGDITSLLKLDDLVQLEIGRCWNLDASLSGVHTGQGVQDT